MKYGEFLYVTSEINDTWLATLRKTLQNWGNLSILENIKEIINFDCRKYSVIMLDARIDHVNDWVYRLKNELGATRIVVAGLNPGWREVRAAFEAGAIDYVSKAKASRELQATFAEIFKSSLLNLHSDTPMKKEKIVIVEDNPDTLRLTSEYLEKEGYDVFRAENLENARRILIQQAVDLGIFDIRLNDKEYGYDTSGIDFVKTELPDLCKEKLIPAIILTEYPDYEVARRALRNPDGTFPLPIYFVAKQEGLLELTGYIKKALINMA